MDRNLGATDTKGQESYGLLYQWGRKDPFIGGKANETVAFENSSELTVCNPTYSQAKWVAAECTTEIGSVKHAICQPMLSYTAIRLTARRTGWIRQTPKKTGNT